MPVAVLQYKTTVIEGNDPFVEIGVLFKSASRTSGRITFEVLGQSTALLGSDFTGDASGEVLYDFRFDQPGDVYIPLTRYNPVDDVADESDETFNVRVTAAGWTFENSTSTDTATITLRDNDVYGTAENNTIAGTDLADGLFGLAGNDTFTGGRGNDFIDGGLGLDSAAYSGFFRSYAPTSASGALTLHGGANEGTDTLTSVETITFKDGKFVADPDSAGAQVIRLYDSILGRTPDKAGLDFYVDRLEDSGLALAAVADELSFSSEFQQQTGGLSNGQFVDFIFNRALDRAPDSEGAAFYTARLDSGAMSRGAFVVDVSESAEHRSLTAATIAQGYFNTDDTYQAVSLLYDSFLGRLPDQGGSSFYSERLKSGATTFAAVSAEFANSSEFKSATQGLNNSQLVDFVFQNSLNRAADAGGRAFYTDRLDKGMTVAAFVQEVAFSAEHYNLMTPFIVDGIQFA
jgi:hypothetical protein